jgi:hypothetical protein
MRFGSRWPVFLATGFSSSTVGIFHGDPPKRGRTLQLIFSMDPEIEMELGRN